MAVRIKLWIKIDSKIRRSTSKENDIGNVNRPFETNVKSSLFNLDPRMIYNRTMQEEIKETPRLVIKSIDSDGK